MIPSASRFVRLMAAPAFLLAALAAAYAQGLLQGLATAQDYRSARVSSYDRSGGNKDSLTLRPGETAVLADLKGPGAIHHIWVTIAAEPFYGRKLVLRMYWDGETSPSVEAPVGDFFGVGHGLNRNLRSLPINNSSEGRARNAYWAMPFARSARVTVTNEGKQEVPAFYYYIDYRQAAGLPAGTPTFHAQYRQEFPVVPGRNYLILEARGRGHYVGCSLNVLQKGSGWWGEGDDMIFVDGEAAPSLHGTGSEDYFSDAWGMREGHGLFYGCPLQEEDFQAGSKASVYRFHIPDPVPFRESIRVTIEHGHANDRADLVSSTAFWYQAEPHQAFPALPAVEIRLPYALEPPEGFVRPSWTKAESESGEVYADRDHPVRFKAARLISTLTSYYGPDGARLPVLQTDGAGMGGYAELTFPVDVDDRYDLDIYLLKGPAAGNTRAVGCLTGGGLIVAGEAEFRGYAEERGFDVLSCRNLRLQPGQNVLLLQVTGKDADSRGYDLGLIGYRLTPSSRKFIKDWNIIGPFDAPDMDALTMVFPPEEEIELAKIYPGKAGRSAAWIKAQADASGYIDLTGLLQPFEQVIAYASGWVKSPDDRPADLLLGSDDGLRVWINDALVLTNPVNRASEPDLDRVTVRLRKGWNKVLLKVLQGSGAWGFHARFADPDGSLEWSRVPPAK